MALTKEKAKKILKHGKVRGHKLTPSQYALFGAVSGGQKLMKRKEK